MIFEKVLTHHPSQVKSRGTWMISTVDTVFLQHMAARGS